MRTPTLAAVVMVAALLAASIPLVARQAPQSADAQLQAAITKETVGGDLKAAIELYRRLADGPDRAVAAKALLRMGQAYEKLGDAESRKAYERLVRDFADQRVLADQARTRLAAMGRPTVQPDAGPSSGRVWAVPPGRALWGRPSPDGRFLAFLHLPMDGTGLWLHDFTTGEDREVIQVSKSGMSAVPVLFSPDGKHIAYSWFGDGKNSELRMTGVDGAGMRVIADMRTQLKNDGVNVVWPRAWSPDGKRILAVVRSKIAPETSVVLVSVSGGAVEPLASILGNTNYRDDYAFSPDGRFVAWSANGKELFVAGVDGGPATPLAASAGSNWMPGWMPDGRRIHFLSDRSGSRDLWAIEMREGRPHQEPVRLRTLESSIVPLGFTRDGSLFYHTQVTQSDVYLSQIDPDTGRVVTPPARFNQRALGSTTGPPMWSPDGSALLYRGPGSKLVVQQVGAGDARELTVSPACAGGCSPVRWLPDGQQLLTTDVAAGGRAFHRVDVKTGARQEFIGGLPRGAGGVLAPDGKTFFYWRYSPSSGGGDDGLFKSETASLMAFAVDTRTEREVYSTSNADLKGVSLSPDGQRFALAVYFWADRAKPREGRTTALVIAPVAGGAPRELVRTTLDLGGIAWTKDGRRVLAIQANAKSGQREIWSYPVEGGDGKYTGVSMPILDSLDVHPDGRRIALVGGTSNQEVWVLREPGPVLK